MYIYFTYAQDRDTKWELTQYEDHLMAAEAGNLQEKVRNLAQYVRYYDSQGINKIKKDVQNIVDAAVNVADGIYRKYYTTLEMSKIEDMIINALKYVKFEKGLGYLFILDIDGNVKLHGNRNRMGKNDMNITDSNGKKIVEEFTKVIKESGEGFVEYYWYKPDSDEDAMHQKVSFIKKLTGLDWYIGAGEYIDYMHNLIRLDMLHYIANNGKFDNGYFFVTNSEGETLFHPNGDATKDADNFLIEGVYRDGNHLAITEYIAQYDWYITAVKDTRQVNSSISQKKEYLLEKREKNIRVSLWIMLIMLLLSLLLSLYLSGIINRRLRNYEEQLKESNEHLLFQSRQALIGELLPMIAHQWRQPINRIASIVALLRFGAYTKECDMDKMDYQYAKIEENVEFMSETIDDFRNFYKPKTDSELVDLKQLVEKAIEYVDGPIRQKDIQLSLELESIQYRLYANEFLQVLINIIKNAADASWHHGDISISMKDKEEKVCIIIADYGDGIPKEKLKKIFEPYYSTKEDSMGLGLYMSKLIIEKHLNGTIEVNSTMKIGTSFSICLYRQDES